MRVMVLANPQAGHRGAGCSLERFLPTLEAWGWSVRAQPTRPGPELTAMAYEAAQMGLDAVLVAGGDGTLHHVANGLVGSRTALGILPCGTANDLARSLGLPLDPDSAMRVLRHATPRPIDLGSLNGHFFLNVASLGVAAEVSTTVTRAQKRRFGQWAYRWTVLKRLLSSRRMGLRLITPQGAERLEVYQLSIANGRTFGGGWRISQDAQLTDCLLDVVALEAMPPFTMLARALVHRGGMAETIATRSYRLPWCRIEVDAPVHLNLDGEAFTLLPPLEFRVVPHALNVLLPLADAACEDAFQANGKSPLPDEERA